MQAITASELELLQVIYSLETTGHVRSLFDVAAMALLEYSWSWRLLSRLEQRGLVDVVRNGSPAPLHISMTDTGRHLCQIYGHDDDTLIHLIMDSGSLQGNALVAACELHRRLHHE